jgi:hypothetical protein
MPLDTAINLDRLGYVRLQLRRGLVKLTMGSALGLDERKNKNDVASIGSVTLGAGVQTVEGVRADADRLPGAP